MVKFLAALFALFLLAAPARAVEFKETDDSYYARLEKTCEINQRQSWYDYLLYADKEYDQCCKRSVAMMKMYKAREAEDGKCPQDAAPDNLDCGTSKKWCLPGKFKR
jgi:hypothetical protein